jgi:predicted dehydrogenase
VNRLRVAVIGCGHLGSIHARLIQSLDQVELVAVVDPLEGPRQRVADACRTEACCGHAALIGRIDAAVIATPTPDHHRVAQELIRAGIHVLIEKPITQTVGEADALIASARRGGLVLQVGHVERFNPAWRAVAPHVAHPQYIEAVRAGHYTFRSTDVSVVLDLMIHDLDLILSLAGGPVASVEALGAAVFGPHEDLAVARLTFANGCVCDVKASRVNFAPQRTMRIFARQAFASIDFAAGEAQLVRPSAAVLQRQVDLTTCPPDDRTRVQEAMFRDLLRLENVPIEPGNAILEEQREFVHAVQTGAPVSVPGEHGREALALAERILDSLARHHWNGVPDHAIGPHAIFPAADPSRRAA